MKERLKDRYIILAVFFVAVGIVMISRLAYMQVVMGEEYDRISQRKLYKERPLTAERGRIADRYGVPVAVNDIGYTVQIVKIKQKNSELNEVLLRLVEIFERNNDSYFKSLSKYLIFDPVSFGPQIDTDEKIDARNKWIGEMALRPQDIENMEKPYDVFKYFRSKSKFGIDDSYTDEEAYKIMLLRYEILINGYGTLAKNVSKETMAEIEERHHELPGIITEIEPMRRYIDARNVAHILGYVGIISSEEYKKRQESGYKMNDIIGKTGIELYAEDYLRGKEGQKMVEQDLSGRQTEELGINPAIPGNDVVLTLDVQLQKVAMESLERNINKIRAAKDNKKNFGDAFAGSVVALDVNSGEVLAMASYPSYDPSVFLQPNSKEAQNTIKELLNDGKNKPAFNRAIGGIYFPGSTYKPITAIAGLEEGVITPQKTIFDSGTTTIGGWKFTCLEYKMGYGAHGHLNLKSAMATSCNIYFHELGAMTGIDKIDKWSKYFGLGEYTGIDLFGEHKGVRANKEYKKSVYKDDWRPADTAQAAIGQFDNKFTPLQIANYISTIANGGKRFKPYLIKKVVKYDGSIVKETVPEYEQIPVKPETIRAIKEGMIAVNNSQDGTAKGIFDGLMYNGKPLEVAGKTGTPETGREAYGESSNSLYVCYAPADDPQIAVAVVIEHGVWGSNSAPIARDILVEYFNIGRKGNMDDRARADEVIFTR